MRFLVNFGVWIGFLEWDRHTPMLYPLEHLITVKSFFPQVVERARSIERENVLGHIKVAVRGHAYNMVLWVFRSDRGPLGGDQPQLQPDNSLVASQAIGGSQISCGGYIDQSSYRILQST
ncbi:hypothetical protein FXO38_30534 [Capsicum annuum]|nr:hypothetical protein FXO38_30534 [Capsicum annuum]